MSNLLIGKGDKVIHTLSRVWFYCENPKQEAWMNANPYYRLLGKEEITPTQPLNLK